MISLASLASWAARKTCIKGVLRRECRLGLSIQPQSQGATLPDCNMPETVGTGFSERQCLKSRDEWMEGIHSPPWSALLWRLRLLVFLQVIPESDGAISGALVGLRGMGTFHFCKLQRKRFRWMHCAAATGHMIRSHPYVLQVHFVIWFLVIAALPAQT